MSNVGAIQDNKVIKDFHDAIDKITPDLESTDLALPETREAVKFLKDSGQAISDQASLDDYTFARNTMHVLIENGQVALEQLMRVAMLSDHPRAYEVVATLTKTISDLTTSMLDLQEKMVKLQKEKGVLSKPGEDGEKTSQDGFSGTTEELLQLVEAKRVDG